MATASRAAPATRAAVTIGLARGVRAAHERIRGPCLTDVPRLEAHHRARATPT